MKGYFLAIGELLADVVSTNYCNSLQAAEGFHMQPGGSPANVAANIKYLGGKAELVAAVGSDGVGHFLLQALQKAGIGTEHVQVHALEPTSIVLVTRSAGTPDFIAFRHADAFIPPLSHSLLQGSAVVHSTSFALSRQPARNSILGAMESGKAAGKVVSIDWNFAPAIWGAGNDSAAVFEKILSLSPLLKVSVDDMARFTGKALTVGACKDILQAHAPQVTCLTCGKDGVWFREGNRDWHFRKAVAVPEVVDVTGAGDAFWAGFLVRFMDDGAITACVENGMEVAARKITKSGPLFT
jgi:fructokinase